MDLVGYKRPDKEFWHGRIDDDKEFSGFRWHQIVKLVDLDAQFTITPKSYVIISYKVDEGIVKNQGRRGARKAPDLVKLHLSNRPCSFGEDINIFDGGSVVCIGVDVESAQNTLAKLVEKVLSVECFPIIVGGGHDVAYGSMKGIDNFLDNSDNFGIINFDAHFDNRPYTQSTSGTMFRQIRDDFKTSKRTYNHLTIGIQKSANTTSLFNEMNKSGGEYILARDIKMTNSYHNSQVVDKFLKRNKNIYVSICCDVFSSAFAPGVSSPQPLGISPDDFMEFFKQVLSSNQVICLDIAEASPDLDSSFTTISLVSLIIFTLINYEYEQH
ncbi:MAG: formimidoylglutamase [Bacilli bacterium]